MFNLDQVIAENYPTLTQRPWLARPIKFVLRRLLHEQECQNFAKRYPYLSGLDFVDQVLDYFNFDYRVRETDKDRIPSHGRVVIIANHPIGSLDGLALIRLISSVRPDVRVIANDLLMAVPPMRSLLLPVNNMGGSTPRNNLRRIEQVLNEEAAVIIFPAGEVSRLSPHGVRDGKWHTGFLRLAQQTEAPILPVHIKARNSALFYSTSLLFKPLSTLLLVKEMFKQQDKTISIRIGEPIPFTSYSGDQLDTNAKVKLFRRHLYRIGNNKTGCFKTYSSIARPENRAELKRAVEACEHLGETHDGKRIYLYRHGDSSPVLREIGRLRELAFRAVGEGSGLKRDIDRYDSHYLHLLLWDAQELEIVGAYRLGETQHIIEQHGLAGLYCHTLFDFAENMQRYLPQGLELGRSFVQPRYWGRRSLDYLWFGIGAFLNRYPNYRYLFGPVSISNSFPKPARDLLVGFYQLYFSSQEPAARHRRPYALSDELQQTLKKNFSGKDYQQDFIQLKHLLANMGVAIPTLYKQYSELCEPGGVQFHDFGIDPDFADCVDGLVLVDITQLKPSKRARYLNNDR